MTDFSEILAGSRRYTLHSHTQFCDGRAAMADFAKAAVDAGFTHYGFSPHSPVPIESSCNMSSDDVPRYLSEVKRLQGEYAGRIRFLTSMEIDYLGPEWGPATEYFRSLPLDYRIGSVHFIPAQDGTMVDIDGRYDNFRRKMARYFNDDIHYVVRTFFSQSEAMLRQGGFDIIGHFDKIGHNASHYSPGIEHTHWYRRLMMQLIDSIESAGVTVEINTKAWEEHHRMFPAVEWWDELVRRRIPIVINSDAHYTERIDASRDVAYNILSSLES